MTTVEPAWPAGLLPYVPRLVSDWLVDEPAAMARVLDGSVVLVDISGFTRLSERLARRGKVGAELVTERLDEVFAELLTLAYRWGGGLLKFGGDALLLWYSGDSHALRACTSAAGMRRRLAELERTSGSSGARLRMSVGVHSGQFHFFLVGDSHRELLVAGPGASLTVAMEAIATSGQIAMTQATADAVPRRHWGEELGSGRLLRGTPRSPQAEPAARAGLGTQELAIAIPLAIRAHLTGGGHEPDHRQATVAFVNFGGVDELLARDGVTAVAEALDALVRTAQRAADAHGVSFLGSDIAGDGGKIILTAGAPKATGDHEERMLLTLREIQHAAVEVPVRMGVNRGHVFAGDVGFDFRRTYTVMGDTVNLAARLMAAARPGQVLAAPSVLERSRARFRAVPLEPFMVKGKARPVHASIVGDLAEATIDTDPDEIPLVGRAGEMRTLREALEGARDRRGGIVQLVGPPGIGKSRIVRELVRLAEGFTVIERRARMYRAATPYLFAGGLVREALGLRPGDAPEPVVRRLVDRMAVDRPEDLPWLPLLRDALDVALPDTPETVALEDRFRAGRLADLIASILDLALPTPTLFVVDDAQWVDDASATVLSAIAAGAATKPWLLVCARRRAESGFDAGGLDGTESIAVGGLGAEDAARLVEVATEQVPMAPHASSLVATRSGGSPLFLLELIHMARASGTTSLPGSIEDVIAARIDDLPREERGILRTASVLGESFSMALLEALLAAERLGPGDGSDLRAWPRLDEFLQAEEGTVRFRQTLERDVAYEGLPFRRRRDLHARVGTLLIEASAQPDEQSELLALHFFHAQAHAEAWRFARIAGARAQEKYANVEAAQFYAHALESARHVTDAEPAEVALVHEALGDVTERLGDFPLAEACYRAARRLTRDASGQARLMLKEAWIPERMGKYRPALRTIARARRVLSESGARDGSADAPAAGQRAQLSAAYAAILQASGRSRDAIRWCRAAIEEARAGADDGAAAHAYSILSWALAVTGQPEHIAYAERALQVYERLGDLAGQALVLNYLGGYAYFDGRWDEAVELYERGRAARDRTGDAVNAAYGVLNMGEILLDQGHLDAARDRCTSALRVWRAAGHHWGVAAAQSYLGRAAARSGRHDEAAELLEAAREVFRDFGEASLFEVDVRMAEARLLAGDAEGASALASGLIGRAGRIDGADVHLPALHRIHGRALAAMNDADAAWRAVEASLEGARRRNAPYDEALALETFAELARATGRGDGIGLEAEARAILDGLGVVAKPWPRPLEVGGPGTSDPVVMGSRAGQPA